jgi:hypothetical protein
LQFGFELERVMDDGRQTDYTLQSLGVGEDSDVEDEDLIRHMMNARSNDGRVEPKFHTSSGSESHSDDSDPDTDMIIPEGVPSVMSTDPTGKEFLRIRYADPWKIFAGQAYALSVGGNPPSVLSWSGDGSRIQDKVSPAFFGETYDGKKRNLSYFSRLSDKMARRHFIRKHTHWGATLVSWAYGENKQKSVFSKTLLKRIFALIEGKGDPLWPGSTLTSIYTSPVELRKTQARSDRLIEVLKTVDGLFLSRYLCYPEESWTWEKFDTFVIQGISILIGDEFLDGSLTPEGATIQTHYAILKRERKAFKEASLRKDLLKFVTENKFSALTTHFLLPVWEKVSAERGTRYVFLSGILAQTRGCGTPPPIVILSSKIKFVKTVSETTHEPSPTQRTLVKYALEEILSELPQQAFTGLTTKARTTVATTATWENTRSTGGTAETIRDILSAYNAEDRCPIRDLNTGAITNRLNPDGFETVGEFIFWACLDNVLKMRPDELRVAFLTVIKEPGKGRSITKGRACVKIVLDLVARICAWPLKKGVKSSTSGMAQSHHAWNSFLDMMSEEMREDLFSVKERTDTEFMSYVERIETYEHLYQSSTDYIEATDRMKHWFASLSGNAWMEKCGIPPILRGIVNAVCYQPRRIYFTGTGKLSEYGEAVSDMGPNVRVIELRQGVLMGDPLTKIVLHLSNIVARRIGEKLHDSHFLRRSANANAAAESFIAGLLSQQ